jgi:predicted hydrocarbon binding protein
MKKTELLKSLIGGKFSFNEGEIKFYDERMMIAVSSLNGFMLNSSKDFWKEAFTQYNSIKQQSLDSLSTIIGRRNIKEKIPSFTAAYLGFIGHGNLSLSKSDMPKEEFTLKVEESSSAILYNKQFEKSKYPVCHLTRGIAAALFEIAFEKKMDAVETKCLAKGDSYCEFLVRPRKEFLKTENDEFKKQLGLK